MSSTQQLRKAQPQTALTRSHSLAEQRMELARQQQTLPVVRALPIDFGDR
ncbi:hypothetical protein [Deinococcus sonorensis]|uniref:Uncharacterized protein n=2 Tax=Deinococcus sonorensis TaxID=309891 RepID=A0AAU7U987_9DEIO